MLQEPVFSVPNRHQNSENVTIPVKDVLIAIFLADSDLQFFCIPANTNFCQLLFSF